MNRFTATGAVDRTRAGLGRCRRAGGALVGACLLLMWSGCITRPRTPASAASVAGNRASNGVGVQPVRAAVKSPAPAIPAQPASPQPVLLPGAQTVGSEAGIIRLTMLVESDPTGATIVVDGRPVGKAPLELCLQATARGFFREYVEIRARFIATNESEESQTAIEEFSPREKVPSVLHFTPAGSQRTIR